MKTVLPVCRFQSICCSFSSVAISVMILGFPFRRSYCVVVVGSKQCSRVIFVFSFVLLQFASHLKTNAVGCPFCYYPSDALIFTTQLSLPVKKKNVRKISEFRHKAIRVYGSCDVRSTTIDRRRPKS